MIMGWNSLGRATRLGRRLVVLSVAFSSAIACIITLAQLVADFRQQRADLDVVLEEVRLFLPPLAASVWTFNESQIQLALDAVTTLPNIDRATVTANGGGGAWTAGNGSSQRVVTRVYPLSYSVRGVDQDIGGIEVVAGLDQVYGRVISRGVALLGSNMLKTFLVSAFMFVLFRRLVTVRLEALAQKVGGLVPQLAFTALPQPQSEGAAPDSPRNADEIDGLQWAFDQMAEQLKVSVDSLQHAYAELRHVNAELERDVDARKRAEEEVRLLNAELDQRVRQRTAELEAANRELGAFAYSVSHDLRAPLRRIEGFSQMVAESNVGNLDERGVHCLNRIRAGAVEMGDMIDSLLLLSRSTRGDLAVEHLDLSAMALAVVEVLREKDSQRRVDVEIQPGVTVEGDRRLLKLVLENLLGNAWKYSRLKDVAVIRFGTVLHDGTDAVFVGDNGAGFDMSLADRLFAPFQRLHRPDEFEGTGIGLATVQRIVARHGGRVWAVGEPGVGATFYFTCGSGNDTVQR